VFGGPAPTNCLRAHSRRVAQYTLNSVQQNTSDKTIHFNNHFKLPFLFQWFAAMYDIENKYNLQRTIYLKTRAVNSDRQNLPF